MTRLKTLGALVLMLACACGDDDDDDGTRDGSQNGGVDTDSGQTGAMDATVGGDDDAGGGARDAGSAGEGGSGLALGFFVTSDTSATADLGGLAGADARCQSLAEAVGAGDRTWRAYLSAESGGDDDGPVHARDRIGTGPWYTAAGELVAANLDELHARSGDADVFLDENGEKVNGQWPDSPDPNEHDILTGSDAEGRLLEGFTCADWTSASSEQAAQVGHSDGLGPEANPAPPYDSWNSSHANESCADTAPRGGAGKIYCFASD